MQSPMRDVQGAWTEIRRFDMIRGGSVVSDCLFVVFGLWFCVCCLLCFVLGGCLKPFLVF